MAATKPERIVKLQVNTTGAWRNVMDFDLDVVDQAEVLQLAASLFTWDRGAQVGLRITIPGDTAPLMNWSREQGWREWRAAA